MPVLEVIGGRVGNVDDDQFGRLFRVLQPQLMRHAEAQLDWAAAQDVVSATLTTMWMKSTELRIAGDGIEREVRALAFTVLRGEIRNEYRARKRRADLTRRTALMDPRPEASHQTAMMRSSTDGRLPTG